MKKIVILMFLAAAFMLSACGSSKPCDFCDSTSSRTKKFENEATETVLYVCKDCYSDCMFCSNKATEHYWSLLNMLIFVCEDCHG